MTARPPARARHGKAVGHLLFFEDDGWRRLWPLTATRPIYDVRCGARRLFEKALAGFRPGTWGVWPGPRERAAAARAFAAREALPEPPPRGATLWWNGAAGWPERGLPTGSSRKLRLRSPEGRVAGLFHGAPDMALEAAAALLDPAAPLPGGWDEQVIETRWVDRLWDLLRDLEGEIARDLGAARPARKRARRPAGVWVLGGEVRVLPGARLDAGAVLDAREGPIVVDRGARIGSLTHVIGPAYVGPATQLLGGRLEHVALGPECRVGGEVEASIFQGYANKRHHGFLGHAVVGEWVNLGALTTNSDLKNNYGTVRVWEEGQRVDSGERKVGCFLGDHVKTGIGTLLATGAVVGPGSNLFGGGTVSPRFLPGWSWWDGESCHAHDWEKFLATARTVLRRRGVILAPEMEAALRESRRVGPSL
jgi:UDP-N-acetylglucosamine diphosphorylase/glucosamine-1-phosphate N-acetyltransferase